MDEGSLSLPPFTGHDEKSQRNYHLALRGNSLNPMIDAATPLLGMVMRPFNHEQPDDAGASFCSGGDGCSGRGATASGAGLRTGRDYLVSLHPLHVY